MHYVIGDTHGCIEPLTALLKRENLISETGEWNAGDNTLWFLGDFTDRGPDGVGVLDLIMRLETEAEGAGGKVGALLGNHDVFLLAAKLFTNELVPSFKRMGKNVSFEYLWRQVGGTESDLPRLTERHVEWLRNRPALAMAGDSLLMHADTLAYLDMGESFEEVNGYVEDVLHGDDLRRWDKLTERLSTRLSFINGGEDTTQEALYMLGGSRLIHGHTPIYGLIGYPPQLVTMALEYNDGLCINVDHCLWNGGPGFVFPIEE